METYLVLKDLAIIIIAAKVCGIIARKLHAPQVVGQIIAGLLIGPCVLGFVSQTDFLMQMAVDQTRANGFEQLELGVYSDNARAIHLYEKFGFERYGIQPRAFKLKDGTYRDEIIMVKML